MQGLRLYNLFLKTSNYLKTHQIPWSTECLTPPWTPSGVVKVNSYSSMGLNFHRGRWQMPLLFSRWQCSWSMPICSWHSPLVVINLTILWGAFHDHFALCCWEDSFPVLKKVSVDGSLHVVLLDQVLIVKDLWTPVFQLWSRKVFPLAAPFHT